MPRGAGCGRPARRAARPGRVRAPRCGRAGSACRTGRPRPGSAAWGSDTRSASASRLQSRKAGSSQTSHQPLKAAPERDHAPAGRGVQRPWEVPPQADRSQALVQEHERALARIARELDCLPACARRRRLAARRRSRYGSAAASGCATLPSTCSSAGWLRRVVSSGRAPTPRRPASRPAARSRAGPGRGTGCAATRRAGGGGRRRRPPGAGAARAPTARPAPRGDGSARYSAAIASRSHHAATASGVRARRGGGAVNSSTWPVDPELADHEPDLGRDVRGRDPHAAEPTRPSPSQAAGVRSRGAARAGPRGSRTDQQPRRVAASVGGARRCARRRASRIARTVRGQPVAGRAARAARGR